MSNGQDQLYALKFPFKDPKFIFFTDFDGTITLKDSNDFMVGRIQQIEIVGTIDNSDRQTTSALEVTSVDKATEMYSKAGTLSGRSPLNIILKTRD